MAHYVFLAQWTAQGVKELKNSAARSDLFEKEIQSLGGRVVSFVHTMGPYDSVVIVELPSDEAANVAALRTASKGFVHTLTMKAWTTTEFAGLLQRI